VLPGRGRHLAAVDVGDPRERGGGYPQNLPPDHVFAAVLPPPLDVVQGAPRPPAPQGQGEAEVQRRQLVLIGQQRVGIVFDVGIGGQDELPQGWGRAAHPAEDTHAARADLDLRQVCLEQRRPAEVHPQPARTLHVGALRAQPPRAHLAIQPPQPPQATRPAQAPRRSGGRVVGEGERSPAGGAEPASAEAEVGVDVSGISHRAEHTGPQLLDRQVGAGPGGDIQPGDRPRPHSQGACVQASVQPHPRRPNPGLLVSRSVGGNLRACAEPSQRGHLPARV